MLWRFVLSGIKISRASRSLSSNCDQLFEAPVTARDYCPSCGSAKVSVFYELEDVPVQSVLLVPTQEMSLGYPKGDIVLGYCQNCGFIFNTVFDSALVEYSSMYEATQRFSPTFDVFAQRLAARLIDRYDLHDKVILEIGCGNGEFLGLLCELGGNYGVGFDPVYVDKRIDSEVGKRITFIKDFYSEKYASYQADFVCCKMTLEHIHRTADFVGMLRRSIGGRSNTIVFFQVPDVTRILRNCALEDIYYEHCSYFSPGSLARLFRKSGFSVLQLETVYGSQYITIEAKPAAGKVLPPSAREDDMERLRNYVLKFPKKFQGKLSTWQNRLREIRENRQRAVLWGSGSKGVAFLTTLKIFDEIRYVVDINPYRQGTYMAGTGQEIVAPDFLSKYKPDVMIVMNSIYVNEIKEDLKRMHLAPEIMTM